MKKIKNQEKLSEFSGLFLIGSMNFWIRFKQIHHYARDVFFQNIFLTNLELLYYWYKLFIREIYSYIYCNTYCNMVSFLYSTGFLVYIMNLKTINISSWSNFNCIISIPFSMCLNISQVNFITCEIPLHKFNIFSNWKVTTVIFYLVR